MPKALHVDRFMITCQVDAVDMGPIVAQLTRMGLKNVSFELVTDVRSFATNNRAQHDVSGEDVMIEWIKEHPTFRMRDAGKHFTELGRGASAAHYAVGKLVEKGVLKKLDEAGHYARADVKHIEQGKHLTKDGKPRQRAAAPPKKFDKRGEDVIVSYMKRMHGKASTATLVRVFTEEGRAKNSVYASCDHLLKDKLIKRVGEGMYELTAKGKDHKPHKPKPGVGLKPGSGPKKKQLNGTAPVGANPETLFEAPAAEMDNG